MCSFETCNQKVSYGGSNTNSIKKTYQVFAHVENITKGGGDDQTRIFNAVIGSFQVFINIITHFTCLSMCCGLLLMAWSDLL